MKKGDTARLIQPVIQGEIQGTRYNDEAMELEQMIEWVDAAGEFQHRWFKESELEVVA